MIPRVLSYPPRHDYVDRLHGTCATLVHRDEPWPRLARFYDPDWVLANRRNWHVAHFHFTWEQYPADGLEAVLAAHRRGGVPIVWTAHDLRNPHTWAATEDSPYLEVLAAHADRVLTLTPGAAEELRRRFGRKATVVPHGPLLDASTIGRRRAGSAPNDGTTRLVLHGKSLRPNLDWQPVAEATKQLVGGGSDLKLSLLVHHGYEQRLTRAAGPGVEITAHPALSLAQLCDTLAAAEGLVLAYRWGTHSGLLELATDLGVPVVAADVGYLREQAPILPYPIGRPIQALRRFAAGDVPRPVPTLVRASQAASLVRVHRELYAELAAG